MKITEKNFPVKIYSRVNILKLNSLHKNTVLGNHACLFNYNLSLSFRNKVVYDEILTHTVVLFENMHFYCTYSIKTKILSILSENRKN